MSKGAKDADVDRLSPAQFIFRLDIWRKLHSHWLPDEADRQLVELRDQLQSLSQEAVREEVLEELVPVAAWVYAYTSLGCDPQSAEHMVRAEIARWFDQAHPKVSHPALKPICALAIRALKREPNAAGWPKHVVDEDGTVRPVCTGEPNAAAQDRSTERASGERTSAGTSPSPAPAAPDVARIIELLKEGATVLDEPYHRRAIANAMLDAAALLARLGQGWMLEPRELKLLIDYHDAKGCEAEAMGVDGSVRYHDKRRKHYESLLPPGASDD